MWQYSSNCTNTQYDVSFSLQSTFLSRLIIFKSLAHRLLISARCSDGHFSAWNCTSLSEAFGCHRSFLHSNSETFTALIEPVCFLCYLLRQVAAWCSKMSHSLQLKWLDLNPLNGISTRTAGVRGFKKKLSVLHQCIRDSSQRIQILGWTQKWSVQSHLQDYRPITQ